MVALSRLAAAGLVAGVLSARVERHLAKPGKKTIGGIPVVNYQFAHRDAEAGEFQIKNEIISWNVIGTQDMTKEEMVEFCGSACPIHGHPYRGGVPFATFVGTEGELADALERVNGGKWQFVEPDSETRVLPEVSPEQVKPWGLGKVGRDNAYGTGKGANIYVTDTGVRVTHSDFGGRAKGGADVTTGKLVECADGATNCAMDKQGHGTHCAGTTAGTTYGVAPEATVFSVKVLSDSGSGSFAWSNLALDWVALRPGKSVVSMSLGGRGVVSSIRVAVQAATNAGVVVVVAAGNENNNACLFSPAYVPEAITVGSTTSLNARSSFSNYGTCVKIWAPGSSILSAGHTSDTGSATLSGTSMACPHVSGAAAIVLALGNPGKEVLSKLLTSSWGGNITGLTSNDQNKFLCVGNCPVALTR